MDFPTQNQLFAYADLVGDYRLGDPPGPKLISEATKNKILDLWAQGKTAEQIRNLVRREDRKTVTQRRSVGQRFSVSLIYVVVCLARDEGDPRAVSRRAVGRFKTLYQFRAVDGRTRS
jgi:hypothetical protein